MCIRLVITPILHECQDDLLLKLWINWEPQKFAEKFARNKTPELKTIDYANESLQHMCGRYSGLRGEQSSHS